MIIKELLPIGSVVILNEAQKRLMIFGIKQMDESSKEEYDYIGVLYPEGNIGNEGQYLFNHEDIASVFFKGYAEQEREAFINKLEEYYNRVED